MEEIAVSVHLTVEFVNCLLHFGCKCEEEDYLLLMFQWDSIEAYGTRFRCICDYPVSFLWEPVSANPSQYARFVKTSLGVGLRFFRGKS